MNWIIYFITIGSVCISTLLMVYYFDKFIRESIKENIIKPLEREQ